MKLVVVNADYLSRPAARVFPTRSARSPRSSGSQGSKTHSGRAERGAGSREIEECKQDHCKLLAFFDLA